MSREWATPQAKGAGIRPAAYLVRSVPLCCASTTPTESLFPQFFASLVVVPHDHICTGATYVTVLHFCHNRGRHRAARSKATYPTFALHESKKDETTTTPWYSTKWYWYLVPTVGVLQPSYEPVSKPCLAQGRQHANTSPMSGKRRRPSEEYPTEPLLDIRLAPFAHCWTSRGAFQGGRPSQRHVFCHAMTNRRQSTIHGLNGRPVG